MNPNELLEQIIADIFHTVVSPTAIPSQELLSLIDEQWRQKGITGISVNTKWIGGTMRRMGYHLHHTNKGNQWIVKQKI